MCKKRLTFFKQAFSLSKNTWVTIVKAVSHNRSRMQNLKQRKLLAYIVHRVQFQAEGLGKLGVCDTASRTRFSNFFTHFKRKGCYTYGPVVPWHPCRWDEHRCQEYFFSKSVCAVLCLQNKTFGTPTIKTFYLYHNKKEGKANVKLEAQRREIKVTS